MLKPIRLGVLRLWLPRYLWPFGRFRDASMGTELERWAAYRYNREQRVHLPQYALNWTLICSFWLANVIYLEPYGRDPAGTWVWVCYAIAALLFVGSISVLSVIVVGQLYFNCIGARL